MNAPHRLAHLGPAVLVAILLTSPALAQADPDAATAEGLVRALYDRVSSQPGTVPDWNVVRSAFLPQAIVVLRTSRDSTTVFTLEGFVQDFVTFIERANVRATGFTERVVKTQAMVFGDIAHVLVLYEAQITGSPRPPQQGVDSFQLIRREGRWWIVSIVNEIPSAGRPLPPLLQPEAPPLELDMSRAAEDLRTDGARSGAGARVTFRPVAVMPGVCRQPMATVS